MERKGTKFAGVVFKDKNRTGIVLFFFFLCSNLRNKCTLYLPSFQRGKKGACTRGKERAREAPPLAFVPPSSTVSTPAVRAHYKAQVPDRELRSSLLIDFRSRRRGNDSERAQPKHTGSSCTIIGNKFATDEEVAEANSPTINCELDKTLNRLRWRSLALYEYDVRV